MRSSAHIEPHIRKCHHAFANYFPPLFLPASKHFTSPDLQLKLFHAILYENTNLFTATFMLSSRFPFCTAKSMALTTLSSKAFAVFSRSSVQHLPASCIPAQRISAPWQSNRFLEPYSPGAQNGAFLPTSLDNALGRLAPPLHVPRFPNQHNRHAPNRSRYYPWTGHTWWIRQWEGLWSRQCES